MIYYLCSFYGGSVFCGLPPDNVRIFSDKAGMIIYEISFTNFARGGVNMSKVCNICGKGQTTGNNVSHSNRKTRRTFKANVQKVSYVENGKETKGYVCTRCLKKAERA